MNKTLPISRETIEVLEQMTKVNPSIWIVPGCMQTVQSPDRSKSLIVQLKDDIPGTWFPSWKKEKVSGFGILDGIAFVKMIKLMQKPYWDFSRLKAKKSYLVIAAQDSSTAIFDTCSPDILVRMDIRNFKIPDFDVQIKLPWSDLEKLYESLRLAGKGKLEIRSDGEKCWFKTSNNAESSFGTHWFPKKDFLFKINPKICKVAKGDYALHLSAQAQGMSKWVSADGKYIYYINLLLGSWFDKMQTRKPLQVLTDKEYKIASGYAEKVNKSWRKSIDAIIETGELLGHAKKKFQKDEMMWSSFMSSLPFGIRAVEMLINIAKNKSLLLHPKIYKNLPASWGTLYDLVNVGPSKPIAFYENSRGEVSPNPKKGFSKTIISTKSLLLAGIEGKDALIRPDMKRSDANKYKSRIESIYFPTTITKPPKIADETFLVIKVQSGKKIPKKTLLEVRNGVQTLLKGNPFVLEDHM